MSSTNESERQLGTQLLALTDLHDPKVLHGGLRLFQRVKGQRGTVLRFLDLVVERRVFFLQVTRVGQDDAAQIDGRRGRVNWTFKSFFRQAWNPSAMIQVCVRQDDRVDICGWSGKFLPVTFAPFFLALEKATVDQNLDALLAIVVE